MTRYLLVLMTLLTSAIMVLPTFAQDAPACEIDVTSTVTLLLEAQAAGARGDSDAALAQIADARAALNAITAACGEAGIQAALLLEGVYAAPNGTFAFNYPEGWVDGNFLDATTGGQISLGSSPNAMAQMTTAAPQFEPGEQGLTVAFLPLSGIPFEGRAAANAGEAIVALLGNMPEGYTIGEVQGSTLDDRLPVNVVTFSGEDFSGYLLTFDYGDGVVIVAGGADGAGAEAIRELVEAVALSVR